VVARFDTKSHYHAQDGENVVVKYIDKLSKYCQNVAKLLNKVIIFYNQISSNTLKRLFSRLHTHKYQVFI
jgi:hypothetical protein